MPKRKSRVYVPGQHDYGLEDFERFCWTLELGDGYGQMRLEDFMRLFLAPYFDGVEETGVVLPKKNAKSSIAGAVSLYHLLNRDNADVILAASARDQARKVLNFAAAFVHRTRWLQDWLVHQPGYGRITFLKERGGEAQGTIRVVPADARTSDGETPTLAVVDEYHRHKSAELYGILRDGLSARHGQLLSISTAGDSEESPLGQLRTAVLDLPNARREGCLITASTPSMAYFEWSLDDDDDVEDFELVKQANPLSIHTPESLERAFNSPTMLDWQWRRFRCGQWVGGEGAAIDAIAWRACGVGPKYGLEPGERCWLGMDVAWTHDCTALVPFVFDEDDDVEVVGVPKILVPPRKGRIRTQQVVDAVKAINERNPIDVVVFDPNAEAQSVLDGLEDLGFEVRPHSQDPQPMSEASMGLSEAIREGRLVHPNDEELNSQVLAAGIQPLRYGSDRWRFVKQRGGRKIDAAIALAMVRHFRCVEPGRKGVGFDELKRLMAA